ncbi:MAG TPA: Smr/MutS family protein, partial [Abditibacteriaceae bacterium]
TFSSHVKNIINILTRARAGDMVLLDEVGAGTDPDEGAALAKAVLRTLQRRGVQVVATTHYGELKQFAISARRFQNASVEFDIKTLRPTYHLRIGIPGASNALDIAARLGMPGELVQRARRYLGRDRAEAEMAAQKLEQTQRELVEQTVGVERERSEAAILRRDYEAKVEKMQAAAQKEIDQARSEAASLVRQAREEADRILRDLRSAARESKQTEEARGRLRTLSEKVGGGTRADGVAQVTRDNNLFGESAPAETRSEVPREAIRRNGEFGNQRRPAEIAFPSVGDAVMVKNLQKEGVLLSAPDSSGRVEVRVGAVKLQIAASNVEALRAPNSKVGGVSAIRIRKAVTIEEEINLIGQTTDQALPTLEKYLDDAIMAETDQVRIVHGKGTGALRKAIHQLLKRHRGVESFHTATPSEGGEGATIVHFS